MTTHADGRRTLEDALSASELRELTTPSDLAGARAVLLDWAMIAGALALAGAYPGVLTILVALVILGGRQLGLSILMHEAAHRSLFRTRWLNDVVGTWLCAGPVWLDLPRYRKHHLAHHAFTGTERDPDLCLVEPFPTTRGSLARKLLRDLTGIAGVRRVAATLAMNLELLTYTASGGARPVRVRERGWPRRALRRLAPFVVSQLLMVAVLAALGQAWLYLLWVAAFLTTFSLFLRIRSIAEHACTARSPDMWKNTRTTLAGPLARLTVAPHGVNFHLEHHLVMSVPYFRLPALHRLLAARGMLDGDAVEPGYLAVLRKATSAA
ncbi:MAG: fatty acid desaturase family protein [Sandaracinaceae bacterium]